MFYRAAENNHGLPHDPFKAIVAPRPIGWIGTRSANGVLNLAPYSFFNIVSDKPKLVMFSSSGHKDSVSNIEETSEFTASLVSRNLVDAMNVSSSPVAHDVDEFQLAGLTAGQGRTVNAPYVMEAFAVLECKLTEVMRPKTLSAEPSESYVVFGEVTGIHLNDDLIVGGLLNTKRLSHIGRMGYHDYSDASGDIFQLQRPGQ